MTLSICQLSHVIIFYSIIPHLWVLLLVLHLLKKKKIMISTGHSQQWFSFIQSNTDHITNILLQQITQEFSFLPAGCSFLKKGLYKSSMLSAEGRSSQHHHFNLPLKVSAFNCLMLCKRVTQMTGLIWPLLTPLYIHTWFLEPIGPRENTNKLKKR